MTKLLARVRFWLSRDYVLWTTPDVRRYFLRCASCGRTVPLWRCLSVRPEKGQIVGCKCGGQDVKPSQVSTLSAAYWLLIRGYLIRKLILRKHEWEPRIAYRGDGAIA